MRNNKWVYCFSYSSYGNSNINNIVCVYFCTFINIIFISIYSYFIAGNIMFKDVTSFLLVRPDFNLLTVQNFDRMFTSNSTEVTTHTHTNIYMYVYIYI